MPNHVTNKLRVTGQPQIVQEFFNFIKGNEEFVDFNAWCPMPQELNIDASSDGENGFIAYALTVKDDLVPLGLRYTDRIHRLFNKDTPEEMEEKYRQMAKERPQILEIGKKYYDNYQKHGYTNWYDWCNAKWGTNWNAYSQEKLDDNTIRFDTAWSGVPGLIFELAKKFPLLTLDYRYADEDWGSNTGHFTFWAGICTYQSQPESMSEEAVQLASELNGPRYDEEDE